MTTFPLLSLTKLRAGTKFHAELPDGSLSAERQLTEDLEAEPIAHNPVFNVYDAVIDGQLVTILVDVEDEWREPVTTV